MKWPKHLNNDNNFSASITNLIGTKANQSTTYTKTEVNNSLALKQNVINHVPGTGERLLEVNFLKLILAMAPFTSKNTFKSERSK